MTFPPLVLAARHAADYTDIQFHNAGAQAEVYSAMYTALGRPRRVAIKVLKPEGGTGAAQSRRRERFLAEADALRNVTDAHVARFFQVVEATLRGEETLGFVMEWLPSTFSERGRRCAAGIPAAELGRYLEEALLGLKALHLAGIAVRDLRPENLLLDEQDTLKVADLGMARTETAALSLREQSTRYQAPEILNGQLRRAHGDADPPVREYHSSDLYSLGIIFYEAAAGAERWQDLPALAAVFGESGAGSALPMDLRWEQWHIGSDELPPLGNVCPGLPAGLAAAVDGMVKKDRGLRLRDVGSALAVLCAEPPREGSRERDRAQDPYEDGPPVPPPPSPWKLFWKRHGCRIGRAAAATAAALALVALIAVGVNFLRPKTADLTIVPDGIAGLKVQWQGQEVPARSGTQTFPLKAATAGRLVIQRGGSTLWDKALTVVAGQPRTVDVRAHLPGQLTVAVNVPAEIKVEGQTKRHGVREDYELPAGRHRYRVTAAGYVAVEDEVTIVAGEDRELRVDLTAAPTTGSISIVVTPAGLGAGWRLTGPGDYALNGTGGAVLDGRQAGTYTVTWSGLEGYTQTNPTTQSGELVGGRELRFTAKYQQKVNGSRPAGATAGGTTEPDGAGGTPDPAAGALREWTLKGVEFAFRWIPAGRATIGSPATEPCRDDDEAQFTAVITKGFWMQETEVTQAQWTAVMGSNPSEFKYCSYCPVETVSWEDAQQFLRKLTALGLGRYRLPTEVEWEYAARAGSLGPFGLPCSHYNAGNCGGNVPCLDAMAWYYQNSGGKSHPVGLKWPNRWNLHDMSGNVWEWVADRYGRYPSGVVEDYAGPRYGEQWRVLRGGSWSYTPYDARVAFRSRSEAGNRGNNIGFRCVRDRD